MRNSAATRVGGAPLFTVAAAAAHARVHGPQVLRGGGGAVPGDDAKVTM